MISFNLPLLDKNEVMLTFEKPPVLKDLYIIKKWLDIATEAITEKTEVEDSDNVKCPWGRVSLQTGKWYYNAKLKMSETEQLYDNRRNGYVCKCGYIPKRCQCNGDK